MEYTIDQGLIRRCQKKRYEQGYDILKSLYKNNRFLGNGEPSKIRLLQSYEALFIHWCELNCTTLNKIEQKNELTFPNIVANKVVGCDNLEPHRYYNSEKIIMLGFQRFHLGLVEFQGRKSHSCLNSFVWTNNEFGNRR